MVGIVLFCSGHVSSVFETARTVRRAQQRRGSLSRSSWSTCSQSVANDASSLTDCDVRSQSNASSWRDDADAESVASLAGSSVALRQSDVESQASDSTADVDNVTSFA